jgi:hypothetical protein
VVEDGKSTHVIKRADGNYHRISTGPARAIPEFHMDEMIYICPEPCEQDCHRKRFHNESMGRGLDGGLHGAIHSCGIICREAHSDEILQLFRDHDGENQHIDELIKRDEAAYTEAPAKPKPEKPEPVHERVRRFLNLEL